MFQTAGKSVVAAPGFPVSVTRSPGVTPAAFPDSKYTRLSLSSVSVLPLGTAATHPVIDGESDDACDFLWWTTRITTTAIAARLPTTIATAWPALRLLPGISPAVSRWGRGRDCAAAAGVRDIQRIKARATNGTRGRRE